MNDEEQTQDDERFIHLVEEPEGALWEDVQELSGVEYEYLHEQLERLVMSR